MGHYRRYEKSQLKWLLESAGCRAVEILSYGFPVAILTRYGRQLLSRYSGNQQSIGASPEALSIRSGVERSSASLRLAPVLNRHTLAPFIALQRLFFKWDLGDGYVAPAIRATAATSSAQ